MPFRLTRRWQRIDLWTVLVVLTVRTTSMASPEQWRNLNTDEETRWTSACRGKVDKDASAVMGLLPEDAMVGGALLTFLAP